LSTSAESLGSKPLRQSGIRNIHLSRNIIVGLVVFLDAAIIIGTGQLLFHIYIGSASGAMLMYSSVIGIYTLIILESFNVVGAYRFDNILQPRGIDRKILLACCIIFLTILSLGFGLKISAEFSRVWSFAWFITSTGMLWTTRFIVRSIVRKAADSGRLARNIVVYGGGEQGKKLIEHIEQMNEPWNRIIGVFDDRLSRVGPSVAGYQVLGNLDDLLRYGRENRSDEVLIALPWNSKERILDVVKILTALPSNIRLSSELMGQDIPTGSVSYQFGIPMLNILDKPVSGWSGFSKIILDRALSAIFIILAAPIMLLIALFIKLESKGPVFFKQKRYGFNNNLIEIYKFRSMYTDMADINADQLTTRDDPRVTKVGAFLRRTSLDELPQLLNVLKGDMSVVGPRPHAMKAKAGGILYEDVVTGYAIRHKVKPGITGWAQVNGWRGTTETEEQILGRLECDFYYIENWSIFMDLYILLRTVKVVLSGDNAY
jgi:Undecaprenyl-phosphate glucose phosphotransferase